MLAIFAYFVSIGTTFLSPIPFENDKSVPVGGAMMPGRVLNHLPKSSIKSSMLSLHKLAHNGKIWYLQHHAAGHYPNCPCL